jgi:hypothetical protein
MSQKIVTVVGATGQQGKAVIAAFAGNPEYHIRGTTRNPDSAAAKALAMQGIEVVKDDTSDLDSLKTAFHGSHIIFGVTDYWTLFPIHGPIKSKEIELEQAKNLEKAASATPTLEHYIWSTLPKGNTAYPVYHFESKSEIDDLIRADPFLLPRTTLFMTVSTRIICKSRRFGLIGSRRRGNMSSSRPTTLRQLSHSLAPLRTSHLLLKPLSRTPIRRKTAQW